MDQPFEPRCGAPQRLYLPVPVDPTGRRGPTRGQAAGRRWRRVGPNAYVPAAADPAVPEQRVAEASSHLGPSGAVTGWAALRWAGATYFDGRRTTQRATQLPVPLAVGASQGRRTPNGTELSYEPLVESDVVSWQGVRVTRPVRSLFYELRRDGDWREAVVTMDMAAAAELVSVRRMHAYLSQHRRWRRATRVARALRLASERSRSPAETRLRLLWVCDAALPQPLVNREIYDLAGRLVCVADLFDEEAGVVLEYDGAEHRKARRHSKDVAREERCRRVGLEYCKVTGPDMRTPVVVLDRFFSTRSRARFAEPAARRWTLRPPPGRQLPESLDERIERREWIASEMAERHGLTLPPW